MTKQSTRTMLLFPSLLLLLLASLVSFGHGRSFDWGTMKHGYGIREQEDNELFTQDVRMPGVEKPDQVSGFVTTGLAF